MITVILACGHQAPVKEVLDPFVSSPLVKNLMILQEGSSLSAPKTYKGPRARTLIHGKTLPDLINKIRTKYLLMVHPPEIDTLHPGALQRFIEVAQTTGAGMVYADYRDRREGEILDHPVNDYQLGSVRDTFDFGPLMLFPLNAVQKALIKFGSLSGTTSVALYDLRLKVSTEYPLFHIQEFLYTRMESRGKCLEPGVMHFDYVDPHNRAVQKEMEGVVTKHLQNIGAYLPPVFKKIPRPKDRFPAVASIIIPVRNRQGTIADAVLSALSQQTDFPFNVIVIDNHSTDDTTAILTRLAQKHPALKHIIPLRFDLSIGGCWNEAVSSTLCGRYAVQLDSDDLYSSPGTLQKIIDLFRQGSYAMVIGSYTLINDSQEVIPPGLIDHREWTDDNGRNNALRVNGLGAPRAFDTALLRQIGFLNVGYGEDYAIALRLSRQYRIGRIYESLYWCRRWTGNTDAALSVDEMNRLDAFKDKIRTLEIMARQRLNRRASGQDGL